MISYINGTLTEIGNDYVTIETTGVGYEILTFSRVIRKLPEIGSPLKMYTYLDVKEDDMKLFGFSNKQEKDIFQMLISVSGVGPKGALAILDAMSLDELISSIISNDSKSISKAKGVGAKTAQKIVIELKDKLNVGDAIDASLANEDGAESTNMTDAIEALVALGYSNADVLRAIRKVEGAETMDAGDLVKAALRRMF